MSAPLPMLPASCSLDERGMSEQLARYRQIGAGALVVARSARSVTVQLRTDVPEDVVRAAIATEQRCCPFLELRWRASRRELSVSVAADEHEPALGALAYALGLEEPAAR
jgi:hypothetical protein